MLSILDLPFADEPVVLVVGFVVVFVVIVVHVVVVVDVVELFRFAVCR